MTMDVSILAAILDSVKDPILFADTEHVVRYMNKAAIGHYEGGEKLMGSSLLDCHNDQSRKVMREVLAAMVSEGIDERLISEEDEQWIYMRAVRDDGGSVLGYYERYEPIIK
ncbi:MAG: PAS domain-containing protein [Anaerolineales bacterium]|nr:PAS domain-containing protein [Anaerolineales bacterium]